MFVSFIIIIINIIEYYLKYYNLIKDSLPKKEFIRNFAQVGDKKSIFVTNTGFVEKKFFF